VLPAEVRYRKRLPVRAGIRGRKALFVLSCVCPVTFFRNFTASNFGIQMISQLENISQKVERGVRITVGEALVLWREAPLWLLGKLADGIRRRMNGAALYWNRNFHIEPTNVCAFACKFCSYRRAAGDSEAWDYSIEQMEETARGYVGSGVTEVHIVGGVHPAHDLWFYTDLIRRIKAILPDAAIKAYTAVELAYMIKKAGLTLEAGLAELQKAGMQAIPGGGAEIFDAALREKICPEKGTAEEWLAVHAAAHRLGIPTNATILYGHAETLEQRIDHLERLRNLQDENVRLGIAAGRGGFNAFIPLKYRAKGNSMGGGGEVSVVEDMKMLAMSRIFLDNIPHIKAYWVMYGKSVAGMALAFGADDLDGTIDASTKIFSMAGAEDSSPRLTVAEIEQMAAAAGLRAVERDTFYNYELKIKNLYSSNYELVTEDFTEHHRAEPDFGGVRRAGSDGGGGDCVQHSDAARPL
jgi:aminodeoxyfutalosine synthase